MSLRVQTFLALGVMLLCSLAVLFVAINPMLSRTFAQLESSEVRAHVTRGVNAISAELSAMESTSQDWAGWDDTYAYVAGNLPTFFDENVTASVLVNLRVNMLLLLDVTGQIFASAVVDLVDGQYVTMPEDLPSELKASLLLPVVDGDWQSTSGILRVRDGLLLVAAHPILTSQHEGPSLGTLVLGRFLSVEEIQRLAEQVNLILTIRVLDDPGIDAFIMNQLIGTPGETPEDIVVHPTSGDSITGHAILNDSRGRAVGLLSIETTRKTYQAGQASLRYLGGTAVGTLVLATLLLLLLLDRRVLARMSSLSKGVAAITEKSVPSGRVALAGHDEIAKLASGMNEMLETLEKSRLGLQRSEKQYRDLFESSRDAIYITSPDGRFIDVNQALVDLLRCPRSEIMETNASFFYQDPRDRDAFRAGIDEAGFVVDHAVRLKQFDGTPLDCLLSTVAQTDTRGEIVSYQGIIRDVTELKRQQNELAYLATHDVLTGLLNRGALEDRLTIELARASRNLERCGVLYVDLDYFKEVNDTQGHAAGDDILR